jgi:tRNA pseudouridine55 synthase
VTLDALKGLAGQAVEIERRMVHPRMLLPEMPSVTADEQSAGKLRNGMQVNLPEFSRAEMVKVFTGPAELMAIVKRVAGTLMQPVVVLG